jgi:hypothetical protein
MFEFDEFPAGIEEVVRGYIATESKFAIAKDPTKTRLRGRKVKFYDNVWLGYIETDEERYYFLTRPRGRKGRFIPISNAIGGVERAHREYPLSLTKDNVADYLHFYYSFTPKEDPMLSRISGGATQFAVPRELADIKVEAAATENDGCSEDCLVKGAVWHFLDEATHDRVQPLRYRRRHLPQNTVSGRIPIQFRNAIFAVDFRVPEATGRPTLSNEELLYESDALEEPEIVGNACLTLPTRIARKERYLDVRRWARQIAARLGQGAMRVAWTAVVLAASYFWGCAALYAVAEAYDSNLIQRQFEWWADVLGVSEWASFAYWWTLSAIAAFVGVIVLKTHRDKVFNWIFRFCPTSIEQPVVKVLDYFVTKWDNALLSQNTFGKRLGWSAFHLVGWSLYLVAAFTSLQMLSDVTEGQAARPALLVAETLLLQGALNVPFVAFVLIQFLQVIERLDPVAEGVLNYWPLVIFQATMAVIVIGGIYRVWVFTVEASPYTFFRRMRAHSTKRRRTARVAAAGEPSAAEP